MREQKGISWIAFFLIGIFASLFIALEANASFPLPPRISANALASDYAVGQADLMLPLAGDRAHNFYVDPNLAYSSNNQGYTDLGVGYRWIKNQAAILGWYVFGGYTRIDNNARLWVANPGIEALGSRWDAHLNGYLVMGDRNDTLGDTLIFDHFAGHDQIDDEFQTVQHAGNGADIKLGYQLFPHVPLKGYVGSYFFAPAQASSVWGGAAGLEYWLDPHVKVFASYTYDTLRRSVGALGLGLEFGGTHIHRSDPAVEERITDPVERYLGELGRGSAVPDRSTTQAISTSVVALDDIAFFSQTGGPNNGGIGLTAANCTFENPCGPTDLTNAGASTLAGLLPNTVMYFNGGNYNALNVSAGTSPVTLQVGQSIVSRTADYSQVATGSERSTFNGGFSLPGNNTLENIILLPTAAVSAIGISASGATNLLITGSQIGVAGNLFSLAGMRLVDSGASVNNSEIEGSFFGVSLSNSSALIQNSTLDSVGTGGPAGIQAANGSVVDVSDTVIIVQGNSAVASGILAATSSNITANRVQISVNDPGSSAFALNNSSGNIQASNSFLSVTSPFAAITNPVGGAQITASTCFLNGTSVICP